MGVRPGDKMAGGTLTEAGAREVNASRAQVASGIDSSVGEKLAQEVIAREERSGSTSARRPKHILNVQDSLTAGESQIFIRRK